MAIESDCPGTPPGGASLRSTGHGSLRLRVCLVLIWTGAALGAGEVAPPDWAPFANDAKTGDELLQFQDFQTVVSATRQSNAANLSAVPVFVISSKTIHNSVATSIPEVLQYAPGMDVLKADRNHAAVGIRGLFSFANDRILGLVDGNKSTDPVSGYTDYQRYPVFLEDIQQIEIVRGPSSAAWGANAFFGVINIITKDPLDTQGYMATSTLDDLTDTNTQVRWGSQAGAARWRISAGYQHAVPSSVAVDRDFRHDDGSMQATVDSKLVYEPTENRKFTFGMAFAHSERDSMEFLNDTPNNDENVDELRSYGRYEQTLSDVASTSWTATLNYSDQIQPSLYSVRTLETGLEGLWNYRGFQNHDLSVGASFRYDYVDQFHRNIQDFQFDKDPNTEVWGGLYLVDRWQVARHAWLEYQLRGDLFSFPQGGQHSDWSGRVSTILALDNAQNHVLRFSGAKAYRAPTMLLRNTSLERILLPTPPFPPNSFAVNVTNGSRLRTETVWSAEMGYSGRLGSGFSLELNGYYQRYLDLLSVQLVNRVPPQDFYETDNLNGAWGYGGSAELSYRIKAFEFDAWYSYNGFQAETNLSILRSSPPSPNKVGARIEWQPADNWTAAVNYRYTDLTPGDAGAASTARACHQMDLSVLQKLPVIHGEWLFGVSDLFNNTAISVRDISTVVTPHVTPGRRFVGRFQLDF